MQALAEQVRALRVQVLPARAVDVAALARRRYQVAMPLEAALRPERLEVARRRERLAEVHPPIMR